MESLLHQVREDYVTLESLKYADLQQLAKRCGIKANVKADKLRTALMEFSDSQPEHSHKLHTMLLEYINIQLPIEPSSTDNLECCNFTSTNNLECCTDVPPDDQMEALVETSEVTNNMNSSCDEDAKKNAVDSQNIQPHLLSENNSCFTDSMADQAELSILDVSKECAGSDLEVTIRDHVATRRSTFDINEMNPNTDKSQNTAGLACAQKGPTSSLRKPKNWAAIHQRQFDKMDSLDVYVEKRQERHRRRFLQTPPKRAAALSASLNAPLQKATNEQISKQGSTVKPKVFVPNVLCTSNMNVNFTTMYKTPSAGTAGRLQNTGTVQKSVNGKRMSKGNMPQTPNEVAINKSILSSTVKPVFDLKASLARPLGYTPHHGKLKPFATAHVDVKQATKAKRREHRRDELNRLRQAQRQAAQMTRRQ